MKILIDKETVELALRTFKSIDDAMFFSVAKHPMSQLRQALEQSTKQERHVLQAKGEHLAPCARFCEANAFQIEIRNLKKQLEQSTEQEPVAWIYQNSNTEDRYLVWSKQTGGRNWQPLYTTPHGIGEKE